MDENNIAKDFSNPMDAALADLDHAVESIAQPPKPESTVNPNHTSVQSPQISQDYGTTDFTKVNNSAPSPATSTAQAVPQPAVVQPTAVQPIPQPVAAQQPYIPEPSASMGQAAQPPVQPTVAQVPQPAAKPAPNLYPANQQIIPQSITPEFVAAQPQSEAVFQPSIAPAPQLPNQMNPTQTPTPNPVQAAATQQQANIPQPGMPMSMGGIQPPQQQTMSPVSSNKRSIMTYWPALVGGGVILIALIVFLIVFL